MKILVVDDEPLGRRSVLRQVERVFPDAETHEARDGVEALGMIRELGPDLVYLDVEMPELTGLEVLRQLPSPRPKVVFVTAYEHFALAAFEENACDYLVKPFTPERFAAAAERALRELDGEAKLRSLEGSLGREGRFLDRLALRLGPRVDVVSSTDVTALVSKGHYTYVHAWVDGKAREYISDLSLIHYESRIDPRSFQRTHRSAIVSLAHVARIHADEIEVTGGLRVPLSRRSRGEVKLRVGDVPRRR